MQKNIFIRNFNFFFFSTYMKAGMENVAVGSREHFRFFFFSSREFNFARVSLTLFSMAHMSDILLNIIKSE